MHGSPTDPNKPMTPSPDSPGYSPLSDPTTPTPSTSPAQRNASASSSTLSTIRFSDRLFLTGTTSSGKSTLAKALYLASPARRRLVIDPVGSDLTVVPGTVTFSDPNRATNRAGENWRQAAHARYLPADPDDLDAYGALYRWVFTEGQARRPIWTWLDEAEYVMPATGANRPARKLIIQGRKLELGHLACNPRPVNIDKNLISQAAHCFVFSTPAADDRRYLASNMGIPGSTFEQAHAQLAEYGFMWWQQRTRKLTIMAPLKTR